MYAGLPLGAAVGWPFSVNAQFDVDTPRKGVGHSPWNEWLLRCSVEAIVMIARQRFESDPAGGWAAVPLLAEADVEDDWLRGELEEAVEEIQRRIFRNLKLTIEGEEVSVEDLAYESKNLEQLITADDLRHATWDCVPLPRSHRDRAGRFRDVLAEIGHGMEVGVASALQLLDLDEGELDGKSVGWFIKLAAVAVRTGESERLWGSPSVVLRNGTRAIPPDPEEEGEMLVRSIRKDSLAAKLGVARPIHREYFRKGPDARAVRGWLEEAGILGTAGDAESTLRALAGRGRTGAEPEPLSEGELLDVRGALMKLEPADRVEIGPAIGAAITVEGFTYEKRRRVKTRVRPAHSYLPPSLEDRPAGEGWTAVAANTSGISFIAPSYEKAIKRGKGERPLPAAAAFFRLLGCEIAPRLTTPTNTEMRHSEPAAPIPETLPESQAEALGSTVATHFRDDHLSEDLKRVVLDMANDRSRRRRDRAAALIDVLDRGWDRLYADYVSADAVISAHVWNSRASVPATWLATAMDTPWLNDQAGNRARPRDLIVRTPLNEAIHGPGSDRYAELPEGLARSPAVRALGVDTDPEPSEVVDQLKQMRQEVDSPQESVVAALYLALDGAVKDSEAPGDDLVGDMRVSQLRARFSEGRGLVHTEAGWRPRGDVYRGPAIFGRWRAVVPCSKEAERLWRLLEVPLPDVAACVSVLCEIARKPPTEEDELEVLPSIYRELARLVQTGSGKERELLAGVPVWTGARWSRKRPVYAVEDEALVDDLSESVEVWRPPVAPASIAGLLQYLGVRFLDDRNFSVVVDEDDLLAGEPERTLFAQAITELRSELARRDQDLYDSLEVGWDDLASARIAIKPGLTLKLQLDGQRAALVQGRAHLSRAPLQVSCSDADVLTTRDCGRAIASLFADADRHYVEAAWPNAWERARHGEQARRTRLAEEQASGEAVAEVLRQAKEAAEGRPKKRKKAPRGGVKAPEPLQTATTKRQVRRLKSIDDLQVVRVEQPPAGEPANRRGRRGLRKDLPEGAPVPTRAPVPQSAPKDYDEREKQHRGFLALKKAIGEGQVGLRDFQQLRGVGADAMQKESFFELKAHGGPMPDHVGLTPNEYAQAAAQKGKFFLVVVAGLEEGHETVLRIIPDPANILDARSSSGIEVYGIRSVARPIDVHFDA